MDQTPNPFESPRFSGLKSNRETSCGRRAAMRRLRWSLLILLVPAVYNYVCFDRVALGTGVRASDEIYVSVFRFINLGGMALLSVVLWFFSLGALEWLITLIFRVLRCRSSLPDWHAALYEVLGSLVWFSLAASALWMSWTIGFYDLGIGFYAVSYPVGILAHLLAAGLYVPLAYRWFRIENSARQQI